MIVSKKASSTCTKTSFSYFTTTTKKCIFLSLSHAERDSFSNWNILLWKLYTTDRPPNAKLKLNEKSVRLHIIMATAFQIIIFLQLTIHLNLENLWTSFPLLLQFFSLSRNCEIFAMQHEKNQWISKKKRRLWTTAKKNSTCWWWWNLHQIAPWYHSFIGDNFQSIVFSINGQKQTFLSQDVWDTPKHSDSVAATNVEEWYQMVIKDPDHGEH